MPGSKTVKKQRCAHKFEQGANKGERCTRNCRGKFCFSHKPKNKKRQAEWFQEKQKDKKEYKRKTFMKNIMKTTDISKLPSLIKYELKFKEIENNVLLLIKELGGINDFLGFPQKNIIKFLEKRINRKAYIINDLDEKTIEEIRKHLYKNNEEITDKEITDKEIIHYNNESKIPYSKPIFTSFTGTTDQAEKRKKIISEIKSKIIQDVRFTSDIINCIRQKKQELELNTDSDSDSE